jgi:hypothetical protein
MPPPTTLKGFVIDLPLYQPVKLVRGTHDEILTRLSRSGTQLDVHCPICKKDRPYVFQGRQDYVNPSVLQQSQIDFFYSNRYWVTVLHCSWNPAHAISIWWRLENESLEKIGQTPSLADLALPLASKYSKLLEGPMRNELHKAIGLAAHGVGIGSFVYLRRVFEQMLDKHQIELAAKGTKIDGYKDLHVDQKIRALKAVLPPFLVSNSAIYGILSKGIHELSEDECLEAFPAIKSGIILILEQDFQDQERQRIEEEAAKSITALASKLNQPRQ